MFAAVFQGGGDGGAFENAEEVAGGGDAEGAVGVIAVVDVEADGQEVFNNGAGRPGVVDAVFFGGQIEAGGGDGTRERKHHVLMPGDFPVRARGFVEGDGLDGGGVVGQVAGGGEFATKLDDDVADNGKIETAAGACFAFGEGGVAQGIER